MIESAAARCAQIYTGCVPFVKGVTHSWSGATEYCINISDSICTIVFRGTDTAEEWRSNFAFCRKKIPYGNANSDVRVHEGFISAYSSTLVRKRIHELVPKRPCRVIVTGHSRGAALAALCALDLQYNFPYLDIEAYLFGCPRIGNGAFARSYNKRVCKTLRVQNGNDIVTKLPPAFMGYRHVGICVNIGKIRLPFSVSFSSHIPGEYYRKLISERLK